MLKCTFCLDRLVEEEDAEGQEGVQKEFVEYVVPPEVIYGGRQTSGIVYVCQFTDEVEFSRGREQSTSSLVFGNDYYAAASVLLS